METKLLCARNPMQFNPHKIDQNAIKHGKRRNHVSNFATFGRLIKSGPVIALPQLSQSTALAVLGILREVANETLIHTSEAPTNDDKAITIQSALFSDTTVQLGLMASDKVVTPKRKAKQKPIAMFRDVETVQFGVTKATPLMPIPADCTIKLALVSQDTRTSEQREADLRHEAEARTIPLLQDTTTV